MSTTVSTAFTRQYERDVHDEFQTEGSMLKPTVRFEPGVIGSSHTFQKIGKGIATTKARHGTITPMNQSHTAIECTLEDFYAGDWVDKLDESKITINERKAIANGGAWALGRKVDNQLFTILDTTSQSTVSWAIGSSGAVRNSMSAMVGDLIANASFRRGKVYGVLSPVAWEMAMTITAFASADFVGAGGMEFTKSPPINGMFKEWMGCLWTVHPDVPGVGTGTSKVFVWNQMAVGFAAGKFPGNLAGSMVGESSVGADITWHGDRAAHFINHAMSGGACMIDDTGVIEGNLDDGGTVPTS